MNRLALLLCFVLILASTTYATEVKYHFIDSSCDAEGRGVFYFVIDYDEYFSSDEALIRGFPGEWYDCDEAHCSYDYYQQPPGVPPKSTINTGKEYMLITPSLTFKEARIYSLDFVYPIKVHNGKAYDYDNMDLPLDCPGYDFSCSLYDFEVDGCVSGDGKFRMDITAKGINQPHRIDLIDDFRYGLVGEKTQIIDDMPLTEASVKYKEEASIAPSEARITMLGNDKYYIEFPYGDTAKWLSVNGKYCRHDRDRFGIVSNFEYLTTEKCAVRQFITTVVQDEPATEEPEEEAPRVTKFYPLPKPQEKTAPKEAPKQVTTEPEEATPKREINFFSLLKVLFSLFRK